MKNTLTFSIIGSLSLLLLVACGDNTSSTNPGSTGPGNPGPGGNTGIPTANADTFTAFNDTSNNAEANVFDVMDNDSHSGGQTLLLSNFDATTTQGGTVARDDNGTANDQSDDQLVYTSPADFRGEDTFTYTISDADGNTSSATVTLNVINSAPEQPQPAVTCDVGTPGTQAYCFEGQLSSFDDEMIDFTVFVPTKTAFDAAATACASAVSPDGNGCVPLMIHSHGFGGSKYADFTDPQTFLDAQIAQKAWDSGYLVITYSQRGFGDSGGVIELMAPDKEGEDFKALVDWAIHHLRENFLFDGTNDVFTSFDTSNDCHTDPIPMAACNEASWGAPLLIADNLNRVDPTPNISNGDEDPAMGTVGYSYGGGYQFNAQRVDPRLDAIMPMGTWYDLRYALSINDNPKSAWIELLTSFAATGSQRPLPPFLIDAGVEARSANNKADDAPHNKPKQVSAVNGNVLAPNGPVSYCQFGNEGVESLDNDDPDMGPVIDPDNDPINADLFMIQGYGDTLFNFNEGFDNAFCWERALQEVYLLQQTSGHPLPVAGPPQYAGSDQSMYLDEVVHCGTDNNGNPNRIQMKETGFKWFEAKLRGQPMADFVAEWDPDGSVASHDHVCITQENTDTNDKLSDPAFTGTTTANATQFPDTSHRYSKEGVMYAAPSEVIDPAVYQTFTASSVQVVPGGTPASPNQVFVNLKTFGVTESAVLSGIPLVKLDLTRTQNPDQLIFAGIGVRRAGSTTVDVLHFQMTPLRVFETQASYAASMNSDFLTEPYPRDDPRTNHDLPVRFGDHPQDPTEGRLIGVTARLNPGDQLGLVLAGFHNVFFNNFTTGDVITVSGQGANPLALPPEFPDIEVKLPLFTTIPQPCNHNGSGIGNVTGVGDC